MYACECICVSLFVLVCESVCLFVFVDSVCVRMSLYESMSVECLCVWEYECMRIWVCECMSLFEFMIGECASVCLIVWGYEFVNMFL